MLLLQTRSKNKTKFRKNAVLTKIYEIASRRRHEGYITNINDSVVLLYWNSCSGAEMFWDALMQ